MQISPSSLYLRLLGFVRPYRGVFGIAIVALMIEAVMQPMLPLIFERLLDGAFQNAGQVAPQVLPAAAASILGTIRARLHDMPITWLPLLIVAMFLVRGVANFIGDYAMHWVGNKVVADLRTSAFTQLLRLPTKFYDSEATGKLTSKLTYDCAQVTQASTQAVTTMVQDSVTLLVLLATMWHYSPRLTLISLTVAPAVGIVVRIVSKRLKRATRGIQSTMGELTATADEAIAGQRTVKTFAGQTYEATRFAKAANAVRQFQMKEAAANDASVPVMHVLVSIAFAVVIAVAIDHGRTGLLTAGGLMGFLTALLQTLVPLKKLTGVNAMIQRGLAASESVFAIIDTPKETDGGAHTSTRALGDITFDRVSLRYAADKPPALDDVTFHVRAGEHIALVGPSGGGKSTLVNLLPRFYDLTSGDIVLDGVNLRDWCLENLRTHIAVVSQEVVLFNDTLLANIAYGSNATATREKIIEAAKAAHAHDFIAAFPQGYDTPAGERGVMLSGGQRQRIAIARALLKDAPILILDEATAALDNESERAVQAALATLMQGRTSFVIAHRLSTIEHADRILVMSAGKIVASGTHTALKAQGGIYANLLATQQQLTPPALG
jgi:ATP-binding cassette, subfamily B, bacterial MsbA